MQHISLELVNTHYQINFSVQMNACALWNDNGCVNCSSLRQSCTVGHRRVVVITFALTFTNIDPGFLQVRENWLKKVRDFEWPGKGQGKIFFWKSHWKWKIGATRCQIFRLKYIKFDFHWGSAPDPAGGAYCAPPGPLAALNIAP